jgi:GMP synthase (glutamine-hydrolysing)
MSHGDQLTSLPPHFITVASTPTSPFTAIAHESKAIFGVQFHPEVSHSPKGKEVIGAFVRNVCGITGGWSMVSRSSASLCGPNCGGRAVAEGP